ncbi:hypothetical protein NXH76_27025 [Blautia schinkii]|nr:hypothetical protein [Blautia schinkii]
MFTEILSIIGSIVGTIAITLVIAGTQKYLSTRKLWQLGAIGPIVSVAILGTIFYVKNITLSTKAIVPCIIILVLELFIWFDGRKEYKRYEIRKMKAKDIA